MKKIIVGEQVPKTSLPLSAGVCVGDYIFVSGQASTDMEGNIVQGSFEEECRRALDNLRAVLEAAGARLEDVVQIRSYVGSKDYLAAYNEIYRRFFPMPYPSRTTLIGCLGEVLKFEIDAIALKSPTS
jgi:2-iminobutanoate/2-iminopropanoate deaminase